MYLSELRAMNVSHTNWPPRANHQALDVLLESADAEMNSCPNVHREFTRLQGENLEVTPAALRFFAEKVGKTAVDNNLEARAKWPVHVVAFALLRIWIASAAEERRLRA